MGIFLECSRRIPIFLRFYSSIIPDVVTFMRTDESLRKMIQKIEITLFGGFFSYENLRLLRFDS